MLGIVKTYAEEGRCWVYQEKDAGDGAARQEKINEM